VADIDPRMMPLAPDQGDDAADRYLASLRSDRSRVQQRRQLQRLASMLCRLPVFMRPKRIGQRGIPVRLGAVPWSRVTPEQCAHVRDRVLERVPTLKAATDLVGALRGVLRIALRDQPGRLFLCLESLRVEGVNAERVEHTFWHEYESDDAPLAGDDSALLEVEQQPL
jgi:hypothetical protein